MHKKHTHGKFIPLLTSLPVATQQINYDIITVTGNDAVTFLQSQFTCDIDSINQTSIPAAYCDRKGKILCRLHVCKINSEYQLLVLQTNTNSLIKTLKKYSMFSKVTIALDTTQKLIGYIGETKQLELNDTTTTWSITDAITILQTTQNDFEQLWLSIIASTPVIDHNTWQHALQQANYIEIEPATSLQFTPQMLGMTQNSGLCFTKGCYLGQEVIARTEHLGKLKRKLVNFTWQSEQALAINSPIVTADNNTVGSLLQFSQTAEQQFFGTACISINALSADLFLNATPITVLT